jgi:hypothetical protein
VLKLFWALGEIDLWDKGVRRGIREQGGEKTCTEFIRVGLFTYKK